MLPFTLFYPIGPIYRGKLKDRVLWTFLWAPVGDAEFQPGANCPLLGRASKGSHLGLDSLQSYPVRINRPESYDDTLQVSFLR